MGATRRVGPRTDKAEQLIAEVIDFLTLYAPHRGSFNSNPQSGCEGRKPAFWQGQYLELLDGGFLAELRPNTADVLRLTEIVDTWTMVSPPVEY